jgi:hypothetical protein
VANTFSWCTAATSVTAVSLGARCKKFAVVSRCDLALTLESEGKGTPLATLPLDNYFRLPEPEKHWYSEEAMLLGEDNGRITKSFLSGA